MLNRIRARRPVRTDMLSRSVLLLTACVWSGHFLLYSILLHFTGDPGHSSDPGTLAARALASVFGAAVCLGMYALLRSSSDQRPWRLLATALLLSVPACALITAVGEHLFFHLSPYYRLNPDRWMHPNELVISYVGYLWMLFTWCALFVGAATIVNLHRRDAQLAAAREAAQEAQLLALRLQINPHFLFNTLNTLSGFILLGRTEASERIVLKLSRFLRHTLTRTPTSLVTLSEEIEALRMYLDIETDRFRDRLHVMYDVPAECMRLIVPGLILLPLAENSIKYGLTNSEQGIEIRIGARCEEHSLRLWLEDSGGDRNGTPTGGLGIGLSNVARQLQALFGSAAKLQAGPTSHGWRNTIILPRREAPA